MVGKPNLVKYFCPRLPLDLCFDFGLGQAFQKRSMRFLILAFPYPYTVNINQIIQPAPSTQVATNQHIQIYIKIYNIDIECVKKIQTEKATTSKGLESYKKLVRIRDEHDKGCTFESQTSKLLHYIYFLGSKYV